MTTTTIPAVVHVDIDHDMDAAASAGRAYDPDATGNQFAELWAMLGEPVEPRTYPFFPGPLPRGGIYRRLGAVLASMGARRDGNTAWAVQPVTDGAAWPEPGGDDDHLRLRGTLRLRWWSQSGAHHRRAWHLECLVDVLADDWLRTVPAVHSVALTVVSVDTSDEVTRYTGCADPAEDAHPLARIVGQAVMGMLGRDGLRRLTTGGDAASRRRPWTQSPSADEFVAALT